MPPYAEPKLPSGEPITWCGPHTCEKCRREGHPCPQWQHVLVLGRACPMGGAISDCLEHRRGLVPWRAAA